MNQKSFDRAAAERETNRIQQELDELKSKTFGFTPKDTTEAVVSANQVAAILTARRRREELFGTGLFADPAWDLLLELFWGKLADRRFLTTELCVRSSAPATTALRWIDRLQRDGWVVRRDDRDDKRRVWVALSARGIEKMHRYFRTLEASPAVI